MDRDNINHEQTIIILGFAGSLRKDSYNKALLRAASELMPKVDNC
jgi:NAD(P)H-dependent FMN reductase